MGSLYKRNRSPFWWAQYEDHTGKRIRKSTGCRQKANAKEILSQWESDTAAIKNGVKSPVANCAEEPLEDHLRDYFKVLKASKSPKYAQETHHQCLAIAEFNGWTTLGDVNAKGLEDWIVSLRDDGRGARTIGAYINALRQFCNWCVKSRPQRMLIDPTANVKKPNIQSDRKYQRRMMLQSEWKWIKLATLEDDKTRNGQSARQRIIMYQTAVETGLRSAELRELTVGDLKLNSADPHVIARASTTKNGKVARQFISDGLAKELKELTARKTKAVNVFKVNSRHRMAMHLRADVEAARQYWLQTGKQHKDKEELENPDFLRYENGSSEVLDFHALRHTCGAWLVQAGVTLPEVKDIMRHSTIQLTIDVYGHQTRDAHSRNRKIIGSMMG